MSFPGQLFSFPTLPDDLDPDLNDPLHNLNTVRTRLDSLHLFLTQSITNNAPLTHHQTDQVSAAISSAVHQIISSGSALLASSRNPQLDPTRSFKKEKEVNDDGDSEIVELDAVELLVEHVHYCEVCGKGFKRDANLRMHMRAHGSQFKTPEALAKPQKSSSSAAAEVGTGNRNTRFSCPYAGCNRNQAHARFRALKSVMCVKNHFKRSHCPKTHTCNRCNKKSFAVAADLRNHVRHCGEEARWRCTCGTRFSRKSKLFGHVGLFEGHMPAVVEDEKGAGNCGVRAMEEDETTAFNGEGSNLVDEDELFSGLGMIEGCWFEDLFVDL
ncbi:zinc finger protein STOP1 homolog [Argentina anserina]|uniref:zinc finger protein STOP1 homolog n=1 Tax=Argentina anserina TaxID=57926 RepID=UPI0021765F52|nr:zinc finger protein STOP1 homolog [Potentilla anserina]